MAPLIEAHIDILCPAQSAATNVNPSIDEEIKDLTMHVRDYQEKLLSTLNARASLLLKAERFELALNDACAMMDIAPYSPFGYLCAGETDSLRGYYALAIKMYDDGLERVPRSHPHYAKLVNARAVANDKKNKRVDFISKLPLDVVIHNIIPRILQHQTIIEIGKPCVYFDVCQTWRQRMALANGLQYVLGPDDLSEDAYERVQDLAPFMRSLIAEQPKKDILSKITKQHHIRLNMLKN